MWMLLEVSLDRSERQKPRRTRPLVNTPRNPIKARIALHGTNEMDVIKVDSDDVVMASVPYLSVWNSEDVSSGQSTVDDIANHVSTKKILQCRLVPKLVSFNCIL